RQPAGGAGAGARRARAARGLRVERPRRPDDLRREVVKRVLVADGLQAVGVDALRKHGLEVEVVGSLGERGLVARIGEYEGLIVRSATKATRPAAEAGQRLGVLRRAGAGVGSIRLGTAAKRCGSVA